MVPEKWRGLLFANPMTGVIEGMRRALLGQGLNWYALTLTIIGILTLLGFAVYTFRRVERSMADVI